MPFTGQGSWQLVGGTSLGAPPGRRSSRSPTKVGPSQGTGSLDGATQTLPALYALPSTVFNAVAPLPAQPGGGANTSTGRGTPSGTSLVPDLVATTVYVPLTTSLLGRANTSRSAFAHRRNRFAAAPAILINREPRLPVPQHLVSRHPGASR